MNVKSMFRAEIGTQAAICLANIGSFLEMKHGHINLNSGPILAHDWNFGFTRDYNSKCEKIHKFHSLYRVPTNTIPIKSPLNTLNL